ncbi:hypothetical protein [Nocardia colli]|uniref:hypothetical protein n=1 Tax=Nocardia colli TaxID=2545717 RepID=UPI00168CEE16|nr:hypothetical protein [Nocardia colli]
MYEKLGAESLTEPDRIELVTRAEVVQDQIDAIQDAIGNDEFEHAPTPPEPAPSSDRLF